jgi:hypothetical protein
MMRWAEGNPSDRSVSLAIRCIHACLGVRIEMADDAVEIADEDPDAGHDLRALGAWR